MTDTTLFWNVYEKASQGDEQAKDILLEAIKRFFEDYEESKGRGKGAN